MTVVGADGLAGTLNASRMSFHPTGFRVGNPLAESDYIGPSLVILITGSKFELTCNEI